MSEKVSILNPLVLFGGGDSCREGLTLYPRHFPAPGSHALGLQEWTIRTSPCLHFVCAWGQPWLPSSDTIYPILRQCLAGLKFVSETEQPVSPKDPPIIQEKISELQSDAIKCEFFLLSQMGTETVLALCGPALACLQLCICEFLFSFLVSSSCLTLKSSQLRSTRL